MSGSDAAPPRGADGLGELIGIEGYERGEDWARARVPITDRVRQPYGIVHGGTHAVLAESVCSRATGEAVEPRGMGAFGQSNQVSLLRPLSNGHVNAEARARHRGRSSWVWEVEISDDRGRLCALVVVTIAVRRLSPETGS